MNLSFPNRVNHHRHIPFLFIYSFSCFAMEIYLRLYLIFCDLWRYISWFKFLQILICFSVALIKLWSYSEEEVVIWHKAYSHRKTHGDIGKLELKYGSQLTQLLTMRWALLYQLQIKKILQRYDDGLLLAEKLSQLKFPVSVHSIYCQIENN